MNHTFVPEWSTRECRRIRIWQNVIRGLLVVLMAAGLAAPALPAAAQTGNELWSKGFDGAVGRSTEWALALATDAAGKVYVAGTFTLAQNDTLRVNRVAEWDGFGWRTLGYGFASTVETLVVDPYGALYAGGQFTGRCTNVDCSLTIRENRISKWDGTSWTTVGFGVNGAINALVADDQGNIYAGGAFTGICTNAACTTTVRANRVAKWNKISSSWSAVGDGVGTNGAVNALAWDGGTYLYAGGTFPGYCNNATCGTATNTNRVARWDGTAWKALGSGVTYSTSAYINALAVAPNKNIYAGGRFTAAGGVSASRMAEWDGTQWFPLGAGVNNTVESLTVDWAGNLYVGGSFTMAGSVSAANIAKWDGAVWSAMGSGTTGPVFALALPTDATPAGASAACDVCAAAVTNQYLYTAGNFTQAGGEPSDRFGAWLGVPGKATYVEMLAFRAHDLGAGAEITWQTALEVDNAGFYLYRSDGPTGPWTRANDTLIAALGSGTTYRYLDTIPGRYYKLEDIDTAGVSTWHGPIAVQGTGAAGANPMIYLPMLQAK